MVLPNSHKAPRTPCYSGADRKQVSRISRTRLSRSLAALSQGRSAIRSFCNCSRDLPLPLDRSHDPLWTTPAGLASPGFRLFPFRSPLLGESLVCFLFLRVLRWFTSPGWLPQSYVFSSRVALHYQCGVAPFGNRRITGCVLLPVAYRSLPRPSSPSRA